MSFQQKYEIQDQLCNFSFLPSQAIKIIGTRMNISDLVFKPRKYSKRKCLAYISYLLTLVMMREKLLNTRHGTYDHDVPLIFSSTNDTFPTSY